MSSAIKFSTGFPKLFHLFLLPKCIFSLVDVFPALLDFISQHGHIGTQSLLLMLGWLRGWHVRGASANCGWLNEERQHTSVYPYLSLPAHMPRCRFLRKIDDMESWLHHMIHMGCTYDEVMLFCQSARLLLECIIPLAHCSCWRLYSRKIRIYLYKMTSYGKGCWNLLLAWNTSILRLNVCMHPFLQLNYWLDLIVEKLIVTNLCCRLLHESAELTIFGR